MTTLGKVIHAGRRRVSWKSAMPPVPLGGAQHFPVFGFPVFMFTHRMTKFDVVTRGGGLAFRSTTPSLKGVAPADPKFRGSPPLLHTRFDLMQPNSAW